jgi:hypothetical protein
MTQITGYKPLEDGDSEYDARSCTKKKHNHIDCFLCRHDVMLYRKILEFYPNSNFYAPKITKLAQNKGEKVKNICPIFNQIR